MATKISLEQFRERFLQNKQKKVRCSLCSSYPKSMIRQIDAITDWNAEEKQIVVDWLIGKNKIERQTVQMRLRRHLALRAEEASKNFPQH